MNSEVEKIQAVMRDDFIPILTDCFGKELKSVILYGSAAKDTFIKGVSDVNILVLTESPRPEAILQLGKKGSRIIRAQRLSLHFLTENEFMNSSDVFPMEYYDIKADHILLWGDDPVDRLNLTPENLRHQVEERLRGSINSLRQALLASRGNNKLLSEVLLQWYGTQTALFRGILRLLNHTEIPGQARLLIQTVAEAFKIDPAGMDELTVLREQKKSENAAVIAVTVLGFLTSLTREIDSMENS